jgi:NAD(P)-dependent dehydrogenase (short-subunit alcohol dehydrogenase family)
MVPTRSRRTRLSRVRSRDDDHMPIGSTTPKAIGVELSSSRAKAEYRLIHYGVTKTAQLAVSRGSQRSLLDRGITVNSAQRGRVVAYVVSPLA